MFPKGGYNSSASTGEPSASSEELAGTEKRLQKDKSLNCISLSTGNVCVRFTIGYNMKQLNTNKQ